MHTPHNPHEQAAPAPTERREGRIANGSTYAPPGGDPAPEARARSGKHSRGVFQHPASPALL